jgi:SAM-dependent methyltransferase
VSDRRTALVGAGYDAMADTWESWSAQVVDDPRFEWLERLSSRLPDGARVVELGCGNGTRETRELAARFELTGVDLSAEQLRRARERGHDPAENHRLLSAFELLDDEVVTIQESEGQAAFHWILARR